MSCGGRLRRTQVGKPSGNPVSVSPVGAPSTVNRFDDLINLSRFFMEQQEERKPGFASKETVIWLITALVTSFAYQGSGPVLNPEYILGFLMMFVFISVPGILLGTLVSKVKSWPPEKKVAIKYYVASGVNILLFLGKLVS